MASLSTEQATAADPVGMIGLGLLGTALAERLLGGGFDVVVWNRTRDKASDLLARGARWSDDPLAECRRVVVCLYSTDVVEQVLAERAGSFRVGQIVIDATTGDPIQAQQLGARLAARGVTYLESPIVASSEQTRQGQALALAAGPREAFEACGDIYAALAKTVHYLGDWGAAGHVKLVNNLVLGLNRAALAEGLVLAQALGLDPAATLEVLRQGNAYSAAMDAKGEKMTRGDFSPQARLSQHAKDVRLMLAAARERQQELPFSQLHLQLLLEAEEAGWGELDNSAIIEAIRRRGGGAGFA